MTALLNSPYYLFAKDLIYLAAAVLGALTAWRGLSTWKNQIKGNVEHETARRLYKAVLQVRDAISHVRNPWIPLGEMETAAAKYPKADPAKTNAVYHMRWEKVIEATSQLQLELLEAEVLWGPEVVQKVKLIQSCVSKLNLAVSQFLSPPEQRARSYKDLSDLIYELRTEKETDAFSKEVDAAVDEIGKFLRPKYELVE